MEQDKQLGLVPQRHDRLTLSKQLLTPSRISLGREMAITAANSKTEIMQELSDEIFRLYAEHPPEVIEWVFREHRRESDFFPSISRIELLLKRYQGVKLKQAQELKREQERIADAEHQTVPFAEIWSKFKNLISKPRRPKQVKAGHQKSATQQKAELDKWLQSRQGQSSAGKSIQSVGHGVTR